VLIKFGVKGIYQFVFCLVKKEVRHFGKNSWVNLV